MFNLLLAIPLIVGVIMAALYKHNGKRELFQLDLVQFVYSFVMLPLLFVWIKSFLFYLLREELALGLPVRDLFLLDTGLSTLFLYIYAFVVIHSLTKTFNLKYYRDPLYDVFEHAEYYHVWLSHVVMFVGGMFLFSLLGWLNVFIPIPSNYTMLPLIMVLGLGGITGLIMFIGIWLSDPEHPNFWRLMKLAMGGIFLTQVLAYFVFDPRFAPSYSLFWLVFTSFLVGTILSLVFERSTRAVRLTEKLKHDFWEKKIKTWTDLNQTKKPRQQG